MNLLPGGFTTSESLAVHGPFGSAARGDGADGAA